MRIESVDHAQMHEMALKASDALVADARTGGHGLEEYWEDQLVHEIACQFRESSRAGSRPKHKTLTYIKHPYPPPNGRRKTDILVEGDAIHCVKHCIWIEVKYKKYGKNSDSGLGSFQSAWRKDLKKLRGPRQGKWRAKHHGYWIWLYVFSNYEPEIRQRYGQSGWRRRTSLESIAKFFEPHDDGHRRLGATLWDINKGYKGAAYCSIMPSLQLRDSDSMPYSALLVTAKAK
jgi:hypothetical protein